MAKVNMDKMREFADSQKKGGDFYSFEEGETQVFLHPPCREDDEHEPTSGIPLVPIGVHYGIGKKGNMVVSLDPTDNPIIEHPFIRAALKKRGKKIKLTGKCPVKKHLEEGDWTDEEADKARLQTKFLWGLTPLGFRKSKKKRFMELDEGPCVVLANATINGGFMDALIEYGDISDPNAAILVRVERKGKGMNTKYTITIDPDTTSKHHKFDSKEKRRLEKAMAVGGPCDLFTIAANMIKSPGDVQALIDGVTSDDDDDEDERPARTKSKKGKKAPPPPDDDDEDDDEEEEEDPPPKKSKKSKKAPPPEEDDDEDEDDEEEDEPPPKPKSSKKSKKSKAPPPDEDEDDEDEDDEDEDDEPPPKKTKKSTKGKAKKSKPKPEPVDLDDDDEDDEDEEEEDPPPKKGKSKKKAPPPDDDDEDDDVDTDVDVDNLNEELDDLDDEDDEEDEEEDEPPPKKTKKTKKGKK